MKDNELWFQKNWNVLFEIMFEMSGPILTIFWFELSYSSVETGVQLYKLQSAVYVSPILKRCVSIEFRGIAVVVTSWKLILAEGDATAQVTYISS